MKREGQPWVWVDIIVYDGISANRLCQRAKIAGEVFLAGLTKTRADMHRTRVKGIARGWKYWLYYFIHLLGVPLPRSWKLQVFERFCEKWFCGDGRCIQRSNDQYVALFIILPATVMERYEMTAFEGEELMITSEYDMVLRTSYGEDYMIPKMFGSEQTEQHEIKRMEYEQEEKRQKKRG